MARKKEQENGALVPADDLKQLAARINAQYGALVESAGATVMHFRRTEEYCRGIGRDLLLARERVRGSFVKWLREETTVPQATAYRLMNRVDDQKKISQLINLQPDELPSRLNVAPAPEEAEEAPEPDETPPEADSGEAMAISAAAEAGETHPEADSDEAMATSEPVERKEKGYPHSDRIYNWLRLVSGEMEYIHIKLGGLDALLAEPDKWDRRFVQEAILPVAESVRDGLNQYLQRLRDAFQKNRPGSGEKSH
jgi:hypothetical protein